MYVFVPIGIDGKCIRFIQNMYKGIKTKVQIGHYVTDYIKCKVGVRQVENLSPFLFSIYIIDVEDYLLRNGVNGFNCPNAVTENYSVHVLNVNKNCSSFCTPMILFYYRNRQVIYNMILMYFLITVMYGNYM